MIAAALLLMAIPVAGWLLWPSDRKSDAGVASPTVEGVAR